MLAKFILDVSFGSFLWERSCFGLKYPGHLKHSRWRWAPTSSQKCQLFVAAITAENCVKVETVVAGLAAFLACNTATVTSTSTRHKSRLLKLWCDEFCGNPEFPGRNNSCSWQSLWCHAVVLKPHWSDSLCHYFLAPLLCLWLARTLTFVSNPTGRVVMMYLRMLK